MCAGTFGSTEPRLKNTMHAVYIQHYAVTHMTKIDYINMLGGSVVRALDSGPRGREFDSRRLRFRVTRSTQPSIPPG